MTDLQSALEKSRPAIEAGLADAERELAELVARQRELEGLIARAKAALGQLDVEPSAQTINPTERLTLHQAMRVVLNASREPRMTVTDIAAEVNRRRLYEKRDRSPVEPGQIHARANKYPNMFGKDGPHVWLLRQTQGS